MLVVKDRLLGETERTRSARTASLNVVPEILEVKPKSKGLLARKGVCRELESDSRFESAYLTIDGLAGGVEGGFGSLRVESCLE